VRYYFDIENNPDRRDPVGKECQTQAQAREHAREVAKRMAHLGVDCHQAFVIVADEGGREVFRVPVED